MTDAGARRPQGAHNAEPAPCLQEDAAAAAHASRRLSCRRVCAAGARVAPAAGRAGPRCAAAAGAPGALSSVRPAGPCCRRQVQGAWPSRPLAAGRDKSHIETSPGFRLGRTVIGRRLSRTVHGIGHGFEFGAACCRPVAGMLACDGAWLQLRPRVTRMRRTCLQLPYVNE